MCDCQFPNRSRRTCEAGLLATRRSRFGASGFTLVELLIVIAIIAVIAALAIPGLLRARISGNEASAIASIRAISTAQATYSRSCADGLYAKQLGDLGTAPSGQQPFLSPDLTVSATVTKSGYTFSLDGTAASGTTCTGSTDVASGFHSWANPISSNQGVRYFGSNTTNTVWQSDTTLSGLTDGGTPSTGTPIQ
ncbi:MAG TPA: prepilin-type N-terminal cleavage/methylation domain-containing protein [Vicinamibacterales bacterium]|nr:prepilin-type N-terminal cleavage/methylation domain-containing protein [Vicinamibacterales bacterium]